MSTTHTLVLLSVLLAVVVVAVLAAALIEVRRRLHSIAGNLATLGAALTTVEAEHLRPLEPAVKAINAQFEIILSALPGIARKAAVVAERRPQ
jgi:cob(I)alamin adenosyltransferase